MMSDWTAIIAELVVISMLVVGIGQFRTPPRARLGNWIAALAIFAAIFIVLWQNGARNLAVLVSASALGALAGVVVAFRVDMKGIPSMVAFQHGMGGVAALAVSMVEMLRDPSHLAPVAKVSGFMGLVVGAATFSGSMLAAAKLAGKVKQTPTALIGHNALLLVLIAVIVALCAGLWDLTASFSVFGIVAVTVFSLALGYVFAMRIGGADMPVLISFLNATAGVAASFCGVIIGNRLLIAAGATVASSGTILTHVMCKAMNRGLGPVFLGGRRASKGAEERPVAVEAKPERAGLTGGVDEAAARLSDAKKVIVAPGYGMALARAQFDVVKLSSFLERRGAEVRFAIHPVAGRMPGHMNVLLAEADVDYEKLVEMDDANRDFEETDAVLVVGACDVVNPAANDNKVETPLSGMPILEAHRARCAIVCNLDDRPGYSGVENPLYRGERTLMLLGDARETIREIRRALGDTEGMDGD